MAKKHTPEEECTREDETRKEAKDGLEWDRKTVLYLIGKYYCFNYDNLIKCHWAFYIIYHVKCLFFDRTGLSLYGTFCTGTVNSTRFY